MTDDEFPVYVEKSASPKPSVLEQNVSVRLTDQDVTMNDMLYGRVDSSESPDIESVPGVGVLFMIDENGEVVLGGVAVEGEGLVYSHENFDVEKFKEERS